MRDAVESTRRPEVIGGLGGFGGAITIPAGYREPVLISSTDGVGTKTAIAAALGRYDTVGVDLVAMCADDVVCAGAEPLFFLDYVAVGRLDPPQAAELVAGVAAGCREAGCALVGGETAEHPGLMDPTSFDLAGCCVGVVERDLLLDGSAARAGDAIIGIPSSGLHSNGFSLVRGLLAQLGPQPRAALPGAADADARRRGDGGGDGRGARARAGDARRGAADADADLRPGPARRAGIAARGRSGRSRNRPHHGRRAARQRATGAAGGPWARGLDPLRWRMPSVMRLVGALGGLGDDEIRATFNGGLGMVVVVAPAAIDATVTALRDAGLEAAVVGEVVAAERLGGARYAEGAIA